MRNSFSIVLTLGLLLAGCSIPQPSSLVPDTISSAPDYFCTWNIQGYIASCPNAPEGRKLKVYAQDLAGDVPVDITREVIIDGNHMTVSGVTINKVGLMFATGGDLSGPGLVIKVM